MGWTIYHNPRCSKSRDSLALLQAHGIAATVVDYLDTPPTLPTLQALQQQLACSARAMLRDTEDAYQRAGLAEPSLSDSALLQAIVAQPVLLQRPIISNGQRAVFGRPPTNLLTLLTNAHEP